MLVRSIAVHYVPLFSMSSYQLVESVRRIEQIRSPDIPLLEFSFSLKSFHDELIRMYHSSYSGNVQSVSIHPKLSDERESTVTI